MGRCSAHAHASSVRHRTVISIPSGFGWSRVAAPGIVSRAALLLCTHDSPLAKIASPLLQPYYEISSLHVCANVVRLPFVKAYMIAAQ